MRKIILFVCLALLVSSNAFGATDPREATVKLYKIYLSTNADCTSPVLIFDASTSTTTETPETNSLGTYVEFDFATAPSIGETTVAEGDYNCAIYEMSDMLTFTPEANSGASCVAGTQYDLEICSRADSGGLDIDWLFYDCRWWSV